jgi:hypothetical protein
LWASGTDDANDAVNWNYWVEYTQLGDLVVKKVKKGYPIGRKEGDANFPVVTWQAYTGIESELCKVFPGRLL